MRLNKEILRLALPSILANITVPLVGMVDIAVAGHLGAAGYSSAALIGGISIGTMLFDLLYWSFGFLRVGTGGLTAQAYGRQLAAGRPGAGPMGAETGPAGTGAKPAGAEVGDILRRALGIALLSGLALLALQWVVVQLAFLVVDCSPEVRQLATQYFYIRIWAAPATLSLFALKGWFIGVQDTVRPMVADLLVNGLNIFFSVVLSLGVGGPGSLLPVAPVLIPAMGFPGIAAGTVIAQWSGFAYCLVAAHRRYGFSPSAKLGQIALGSTKIAAPSAKQGQIALGSTKIATPSAKQPQIALGSTKIATPSAKQGQIALGSTKIATPSAKQPQIALGDSTDTGSGFFTLNRDLFLRSLGMIAVYIGFTVISARYGDMVLAVSAILMKLLMIFSYFSDGFAYAGEALTGRFIGAGSREGVSATVRGTFLWGLAVAAFFMLVYGLGGVPLFQLMSSDPAVVNAGRPYIPWLLLMPLIGCPAFIWDGIFIGATASRDLRNSTLLCALGFFAVWFAGRVLLGPGITPKQALHLLMGAYFVHLAVRALYLTLRYKPAVMA